MAMVTAVLLAAAFAGLFAVRFVRRPRAFGTAIVLTIVGLLGDALGAVSSWAYFQAIADSWTAAGHLDAEVLFWVAMMTMPVMKVIAAILMLRAFWPGGSLMQISADPEPTAEAE